MITYLLVYFSIAILSLIISGKKRKYDFIIVVLIILILCLLGGLRAYDIGTDISVYGQKWFNEAINYDDFTEYVNRISSDIGYLFINYIVSRFSSNFSVFLFVLQLICNCLIILTFFKFRDKANFCVMISLYYFIYFFRSFNLLRQSLALAIIFWGYYYLINGSKKKYILCVLIAYSCHSTAVIGIVPLILDKILASNIKYKNLIIIALFAIITFIVFNIKTLFTIFYSFGLVSDRMYNSYMIKYLMGEMNVNVSLTLIDFLLFIVSIFYYYVIKKEKHDKKDELLFSLSGLDFLTSQIGAIIKFGDRAAFYFGYLKMFFIPCIIKKISADKKTELILSFAIICLGFLYWYNAYVIQGYGEIIPYKTI